jgi:amino acid adenylation domain-containing protein
MQTQRDSLHGLLERSAARRPGHTAVEDAERNNAVTYGEFNANADRVKDALVRIGVKNGDRVGIYVPKSIASITAVFGILKSGGAYVPVDPGAPPKRNAYIFQDCAVKGIVVANDLIEGLQAEFDGTYTLTAEPLSFLDGFDLPVSLVRVEASGERPPQPSIDNLSYILYTSGSTGKPKGVIHTHASALSFVRWTSDTVGFTDDDRFSSHAPFHFDLSILDIYVPLLHGATLILIGEELGKTPARLGPMAAERRISVWYSTPSILRLLVEYGGLEQHDFSAMRVVFFAGEVFPIKHLRALLEKWPHPVYYNLYGPTETNVCTYFKLPPTIPDTQVDPFPIGPVCENDRAIVVDGDNRIVPEGEEGELLITGGSVMQGYWNLPERSAEAYFVDAGGTRWYRTGDIVREAEGGVYLFVGRRDRMVKRRGYRVELGEIEAALYRHPAVTEAAVVALPNAENGTLIKAFLSWSDGKPRGIIEMKKFCADNLPNYMIPDRFSSYPTLPKTSTDKINYQALKELD